MTTMTEEGNGNSADMGAREIIEVCKRLDNASLGTDAAYSLEVSVILRRLRAELSQIEI